MSYLGTRNAVALGVSQHMTLGGSNLLATLSPSLLLQFVGAETLDPRITFTRSTTATYFNSAGVLTTTGFNLLTYSTNLSTGWTKGTAATWALNSGVAPDGTTTALGGDGVSGTSRVATGSALYVAGPAITGGSIITLSVYVRAKTGTASDVCLRINETGGNNTIGPGNTVGTAWRRISLTVTTAVGATAAGVTIGTVTGTADLFIWGAQLEVGASATTYIPTEASPSGAPRFDYNPTTLASLGLLIEEQRTNLLLYSEQFDNAAWTKTRSSIIANAAVSPDGTMNADKLVEDTTASATHQIQLSISYTSGTTYTRSLYAKAAERTGFRFQFPSSAFTSGINAYFDLATGTVGSVSAGVTATITPVGNGWYRCTATATATTTATGTEISCGLTITTNIPTYTGDGTSGIFIWGAQLEVGAFATSYIPTVASQVTRAADVASMTGTNFSSWYNAGQGTYFFHGLTGAGGVFRTMLDGTAPINQIYLSAVTNSPAISNGIASSNTVAGNSNAIVAYGFNATGQSICLNGGAVATNTSTQTAASQLTIGRSRLNAEQWNSTIRQIAYYPRRLTDAELQAITA